MRDKMESTPSSRFDPKAVEVPVRIGGVLLETGARDFSVRVGKDIVVEPSRGGARRVTPPVANNRTAGGGAADRRGERRRSAGAPVVEEGLFGPRPVGGGGVFRRGPARPTR